MRSFQNHAVNENVDAPEKQNKKKKYGNNVHATFFPRHPSNTATSNHHNDNDHHFSKRSQVKSSQVEADGEEQVQQQTTNE